MVSPWRKQICSLTIVYIFMFSAWMYMKNEGKKHFKRKATDPLAVGEVEVSQFL